MTGSNTIFVALRRLVALFVALWALPLISLAAAQTEIADAPR